MKRNIISIICVICISLSGFSQTSTDILVDSAVVMMDKQNYEESLQLLKSVVKDNPEHFRANYELAYLLSMMKQYDESIELLKRIENSADVNDRYYQMLGTIYDYKNDANEAIKTYQKGLVHFPKSGRLHVELGMMYHKQNKLNEALDTYEKGILAEPMFPSNYYYAGLLLLGSSEPVWGLMYGEIFLCLESYGNRAKTMSEYLTKTLIQHVELNDTAFVMQITTSGIHLDQERHAIAFSLPYIYQASFNAGGRRAINEGLDELNLYSLGKIHDYQLKHGAIYYKNQKNALYEYILKIQKAGFMEEYCAFLYKGGYPSEYSGWMTLNKDRCLEFMEWRQKNPLVITDENVFSRIMWKDVIL